MKKNKYIFASLLILVLVFITSVFGVFDLTKKEEFNFELRYEFKTNISNFSYPKKLPKNKYKNYWIEFEKRNSNLSWFDSINIDLRFDKIFLDIKDKHVVKIDQKSLVKKDLQIFNLNSIELNELYLILKQNRSSFQIEMEVKKFCESINDKFLFQKGISKFILF
ncbi:hypothetical protein CK556_02040 [Mesoplasma chauliocola]|uniref:Uncharacterized protein n=1 Tax=Mesoplasma chauliocola TaxID=216427 RepID=A0A249SNC0_9MOLU|nr:hypothetical protein [Mesoplasma chauliocola]ASZ09136.1 hypothetical protein CK556_02040 [Mesoplasma chauliocola]